MSTKEAHALCRNLADRPKGLKDDVTSKSLLGAWPWCTMTVGQKDEILTFDSFLVMLGVFTYEHKILSLYRD